MAEPHTPLAVENMAEIADTTSDGSRRISLPMGRQPDQSAGRGKAPPRHDEARKEEEEEEDPRAFQEAVRRKEREQYEVTRKLEEEKAEWERKLEAEKKAAEEKAE
jgi:hypothetical protein